MSKASEWLSAGGSSQTRPVFTGARVGARTIIQRPRGQRARRAYVSIQVDDHTVIRISPREALALGHWLIDTFREPPSPTGPQTSALGHVVGAA